MTQTLKSTNRKSSRAAQRVDASSSDSAASQQAPFERMWRDWLLGMMIDSMLATKSLRSRRHVSQHLDPISSLLASNTWPVSLRSGSLDTVSRRMLAGLYL